jgi:PKD repeat protein
VHRISQLAYGLTCVLLLLAAATAGATTIVMPTDEQLVEKAPVIVSGTVISTTPVDRDGTVWTETRVAVSRTLKGTATETLVVAELGGVLGNRITKIFGSPEFTAGESVLLFLSPDGDRYRVVDLFVGKFGEGRTLDGQRLWLRPDSEVEVNLLDRELRPLEAKNVQRDAGGFEAFVRERIAGRTGAKTYGVENPVLDTTFDSTGGRIKSNFTLIDEPTVYRWYKFDEGQSVAWYHSGTQAGYSNGGVGELQTALSQWVSYAEAKIRYTYAGTLPVAPKGLNSRNNYNEVLFNDPLNEIAGAWNGTSGVVGQGGFNGIENGGFFNATFTADEAHPAGSIRAYAIVEAALAIQNGVSPTTGISSNRMAEIVSHELGHTLGFGHSSSSGALMSPSVTGLGPSLRPDDQMAARWLYPNGTSTPGTPVPNAPSGLTVNVTGSNADLAWNDNANNETSQAVYLASGNGPFAKAGDVAANAESVRLSGLAAGTYRAYVVAVNPGGNSAQSNTVTFSIAGVPAAAFTFTPQSGNAGVTTFTFTDQSSGTVSSRSWNFGDGTSSTQAVASHVYASSGIYPVTLTVSGPGGSSAVTHNVTVSGALSAQFAFTPPFPAPGDFVQFTDLSGGGPAAWSWSFGDGTTSTQQNPSKSWSAAGTFNVTLTVFRNGGSASTTRPVSVANSTPGTQPLVATFDTSRTTATPGQNIVFTDRSTGTPASWSWNFGDGTTSSVQSPVHAYATVGTYTVTLLASKPGSQSSFSKQIVVTSVLPYRTLISAAAQTGGAGGTSWRTELSLFNAGLETATVTLRLLPGLAEKTLSLAPRQSVTYANALLEVFNLTSGAGAVSIEGTSAGSSAQLRVTSRTFTTGATGTYGQSVPEVQPQQLVKTLYITGIQSNDAFRTNLGFANRAESDVAATLTLYSRTGGTVATKNVTVTASSFQQSALWAYFPEVQGESHEVLTLRISSNVVDTLSVYASVVDNRTQDPIYIQAVPAPSNGALVLPAVGRAPGANGTFWRSDVTLFNPNSDAMTITLRYNGTNRTLSLGARDTEVLDDILSSYGLTAGSGALSVSWTASTGPVVTSRTYTSVETGGTFGQSIDPIAELTGTAYVPGLRNDSAFRSNLGFVNGGNESETFTVIALSPFGSELARTTITLAAREQRQDSVSSLFPNVNASSFTLSVEGDANAQLFVYGSMVDNKSGDPVFFAGQ